MEDRATIGIGDALFGFQSALKEGGSSLKEYIEKYYYKKSNSILKIGGE